MHLANVVRVLGLLLMLFSCTYITPIVVALIYTEYATINNFLISLLFTLICGVLMWGISNYGRENASIDLSPRDGFIITVLFWSVLSLFAAMPFFLEKSFALSVSDAIFESISGLTTTGATVIVGLDLLPKSLLFYRQQLQWLGGIGLVVIAVAILPMLGIGGVQLYRTEIPGLAKDKKLTPRIAETAKALFIIYCILTFACGLSYWLAGMNLFDAISHSFSTVAIGGFSTHDKNMGYFDEPAILLVSSVFMILSALNYALHFYTITHRVLRHYVHDTEAQVYLLLLLVSIAITLITLVVYDFPAESKQLINYTFQVVSLLTTTGFTTTNVSNWPTFIPFLLISLAVLGSCSGSTGGGIKIVRLLVMIKQVSRQLRLMVHPHAIFPLKMNNYPIDEKTITSVFSFIGIYLLTFYLICILLMANGIDYVSAWSITASMLSNLGPSIGEFADNYVAMHSSSKWILCFAMLLGRLELFTLLILLMPTFWRK